MCRRDHLHAIQFFQPALGLTRLAGFGSKAGNKGLDLADA